MEKQLIVNTRNDEGSWIRLSKTPTAITWEFCEDDENGKLQKCFSVTQNAQAAAVLADELRSLELRQIRRLDSTPDRVQFVAYPDYLLFEYLSSNFSQINVYLDRCKQECLIDFLAVPRQEHGATPSFGL